MKYFANWKLNKTSKQTIEYFEEFNKLPHNATDEMCFFVSSPLIVSALATADFSIGAQNVATSAWGAMTGETSIEQVVDLGVDYVLIGHSERRNQFNETDVIIAEKMNLLQHYDVCAVLCVGERTEERECKVEVVSKQISMALSKCEKFDNIIIAYEPVWAIGTGLTPTCEEIQSTIDEIKHFIKTKFGVELSVLYGGSVNEKNAREFKAISNLDGFLVGGASLDPQKFSNLINA